LSLNNDVKLLKIITLSPKKLNNVQIENIETIKPNDDIEK